MRTGHENLFKLISVIFLLSLFSHTVYPSVWFRSKNFWNNKEMMLENDDF